MKVNKEGGNETVGPDLNSHSRLHTHTHVYTQQQHTNVSFELSQYWIYCELLLTKSSSKPKNTGYQQNHSEPDYD